MLYVKEIRPSEFDYLPLNWSEVFGNSHSVVVEIGFGSGEYLFELARRYPEKNFVGFEVSITSMKKANNRLRELDNVRLVITDARFGMREFFGPRTVEKVIMNFPIPWDKKSHERRRVIVPEFFDTLANVLIDGGLFELATDVRWYAERAIETGVEKGYFQLVEFLKNPDREVKTRYERKWLSYGRDIFSVTLKKVKHAEVERLIGGPHEMPHIKCWVEESKFSELTGKVFKDGNKVVVVKGVYKSVENDAYIIKVISSDGDFQQHYYLVVYPEDGEWIIKLDSASNPYRTPAVKWSVKAIANYVR
uniref:tRNA (guanine-N(7)-)-methyltransferase n=1 Tax=Fervidobacterium thailandense TaxID=1008305 RepID=A0A7C4W382_9BACT